MLDRWRYCEVAFGGLSTLCIKCGRRVELLLDASLRFQCLFGLLRLRGAASGRRDCGLTDAAGGKRKTRLEPPNYLFHS